MAHFKTALSSLSPIPYDDLPPENELPQFIKESFAHAELVVNSIPTPPAPTTTSFEPKPANSASNAEETYCEPTQVPVPPYERDPDSVKGWGKPYKMSAKDNPLGVQVYKMAAHDRHGAWFSRRSVHQGLGFEKWRTAASHEFLESLKVQEGPGSGAVRGVGADRRVEKMKGPHESTLEVWQTSSAFPGPVTPRESLTLLISSSNALSERSKIGEAKGMLSSSVNIPRHWMVVSRPTRHADAPDRPNLVKMEYESVEMIREIPIEGNTDPESNPVEWLMITRSDPGGGIPRFMVERGTPGSIVSDVSKFLNWATSKSPSDFDDDEQGIDAMVDEHTKTLDDVEDKRVMTDGSGQEQATALSKPLQNDSDAPEQPDGLVSKAMGAVESTVSGYLPYFQQGASPAENHDSVSDTSSDFSESSDGTFRSALHEPMQDYNNEAFADSNASLPRSSTNSESKHGRNASKELDRLVQKREQLDEKARKDRESFAQKTVQASEKEEKERNKMLDKHEKQRKKQEERYQKELAKLDEKRIKEERKEEARRRKAEENNAHKKLKQELSEWKSRCQVAEKEADLLRKQVESLQRENTAVIARLPEDEAKSVLAASKSKSVSASSQKAESTKSGGS